MNLYQKLAALAGAALIGVRLLYPVRYAEVPGFRISDAGGFPEFMQKVDWSATGTHVLLVAVFTAAAVIILKGGKR